MPAAIIALLSAIVPMLPALEQQIVSIINEIKNKGDLSPDAIAAIHALAVAVHQQVVDEEAKRLG